VQCGREGQEGVVIYLSLFAIAFAAATILPLQSEAVLTALLVTGDRAWWLLLAIASVGNTLGAAVNWWLGREINRFRDRKWFPASPKRMAQAEALYARYGRWCLIFAWVPVIGDALTVVAGVLKENLWLFLLLVGIGKTGRYLVLAAGLAGVLTINT
jgi:membrane protein YqaA with SNARE-associated domain